MHHCIVVLPCTDNPFENSLFHRMYGILSIEEENIEIKGGFLMNKKYVIKRKNADAWKMYLIEEEKSRHTVEKYIRDLYKLIDYLPGEKEVTKNLLIQWKGELKKKYAVRSVNSIIVAVNNFLTYMGWYELRIKTCRVQREIYCEEDRELTKEEYFRLLDSAKSDKRLYMMIETICSTGIRVSELQYFTVEAVRKGQVTVVCKNKVRNILLPKKLRRALEKYSVQKGIREGIIFRTRNGKPVDRSNFWVGMKKLCDKAGVNRRKVFPHNLRKLFARTFYNLQKDIAKLADILGHSSIETTRIYIISTGREHRRKIERLGLVV